MSDLKQVKIAILAMGGEGGGVLTRWLAHAAGQAGYLVQTSSVPGAAQRAGATIYYVELFPREHAETRGKAPVLGLAPMPGDVDIVIASELMEAGRAIERGLVTPDRTTLIASVHREYTMAEKTALSDARADQEALLTACRETALRFVGFDMAGVAEQAKSVISAVLLGALAGSRALSIPAGLFEEAIREAGVNAAPNSAAFEAGFAGAQKSAPSAPDAAPPPQSRLPAALVEEVYRHACGEAQPLIFAGLERTADYQDLDYAALYWRRLLPFVTLASNRSRNECELLTAAARQLALAMTYADPIRVSELKLRASRFKRIRAELGIGEREIIEIGEFMHPRLEEVADTMPFGLGRRLFKSALGKAFFRRLTAEGRVVCTTSLRGFFLLYFVASLKSWRRGSLRYARETERLEEWLDTVWAAAKHDLQLATGLACARSLLRGYGETYERGVKKFEMICEFVKNNRFSVPADGIKALIEAAQAEDGTGTLESAIAALRSQRRPAKRAMA